MVLRRFWSVQGLSTKLLLAIWLIYLVLGNLARVGDFFSTGGLPLIEVLLYTLSVFVYLSRRVPLSLLMLLFSTVVMLSWALGLASNNLLPPSGHMIALLYALRLVLMVYSGHLIGWLLSKSMTPNELAALFKRILLVQVTIGLILYIIFPHAPDLWSFLRSLGLNFAGDPHERRLLGPQLDPNFFGNILVFGLLLSLAQMSLPGRSARLWSGAYFVIFCIAIVLTVSRSSLLGALLGVAVYQGIMIVFGFRQQRYLMRGWSALAWIGVPFLVALPMLLGDELSRLVNRLVTTSEDDSALTRLVSTLGATGYLTDLGVFLKGVGYNYIPLVVPPDYIVTGFYSSTLNALVTFGLPLATVLIALVIVMCYKSLHATQDHSLPMFAATTAYLIASFAMSWFNNLLYYPLFLFMILPWMFYWYWYRRLS